MALLSLSGPLVHALIVVVTVLLAQCVHAAAPSLPDFRLPAKLEPDFANRYPNAIVNVSSNLVTQGRTIAIPLPPKTVGPASKFRETQAEFLKTSLPSLLTQFNVPSDQIPEKVNKGIPLLMEFYAALADDKPLERRSSLVRRNIFDDIGDFFGDIGCSIATTAVGVPLFLYSAAVFSLENAGNGQKVTDTQNFFFNPIVGDIALSGPATVYYKAVRSVGFNREEVGGTTFNRDIYTKHEKSNDPTDPKFRDLTNLLLHELAHVQQYRARNYNLVTYAHEYAFQLCKHGYSNMRLEKQAEAVEGDADKLFDGDGRWFFNIWQAKGLRPSLGFPKQAHFATLDVKPCGRAIELPFENGVLQIKVGEGYRTFTSAEINTRQAAQCATQPPCPKRKIRRDPNPLPPPPQPGDVDPIGQKCVQSVVDSQNKECKQKQTNWAITEAFRPFLPFNFPGVPITKPCTPPATPPPAPPGTPPPPPGPPPPPPPPPKPPAPLPGCPTNCQTIKQISSSAKSCRSEEPPPGCFATQSNKECLAARKRCGQ
ncbi:MAG: hypothetical protein M1833_005873 [Piccolia ochrophora]|nr:MAG: hypothetical protein M1833_005873 [Piccolia ochrophora]